MKTFFLFITLFLLISVQSSTAQNKITSSVLGNGATTSAGGDFKIACTLWQPRIGVAAGASAGFNVVY